MTQEDPSDLYLTTLKLLEETQERLYYIKPELKLVVASWKDISRNDLTPEAYRHNALKLVQLLEVYKPTYIIVDCRKLGFEMSDSDHRWYINSSKDTWKKSRVKKIAFIFKENIAAQAAMEGLKDIAMEENAPVIQYRIFETNAEAANWLVGSR